MGSFTPSTAPGCRAPHFFLDDGRSLYGAFGAGYTLLRFDASADAQPLMDAAAARAVPITLLDLAGDNLPPKSRMNTATGHSARTGGRRCRSPSISTGR